MRSGLLDGVGLVDHHCHGVVRETLDRTQFEALLTEAEGPGPLHPSLFDTEAGFGVRAICAPLLDLPRFATPDAIRPRREAIQAGRRFQVSLPPSSVSVIVLRVMPSGGARP